MTIQVQALTKYFNSVHMDVPFWNYLFFFYRYLKSIKTHEQIDILELKAGIEKYIYTNLS